MHGNSGVGKSAIRYQMTHGYFHQNLQPTDGIDISACEMKANDAKLKLDLWELTEKIEPVERFMYCKGADAAILVYDVTNNDSFEALKNMIDEMDMCFGPEFPVLILANKIDLERAITEAQGKELAEEHNYVYAECSAKHLTDVKAAMIVFTQRIIKYKEDCG